ncbi:MAG: hydroxyethylthiazole kinase [Pseudomonadota bacterium]
MAVKTLLDDAMQAINALRSGGCHVHSVTNTVAQNFTANVLLACGATVSMTANPEEIESFLAKAQALHINLGTLDEKRVEAITKAVKFAGNNQIPVTLDPVMIHMSKVRQQLASDLAESASIIRCNQKEAEALGISGGSQTRLVKTGSIDEVETGDCTIKVKNGHPMMSKVIATGCAQGALISALSAKTSNLGSAALAGVLWFSVAGEVAAEKVNGPGSFQMAFLDELHGITVETIRRRAKLS